MYLIIFLGIIGFATRQNDALYFHVTPVSALHHSVRVQEQTDANGYGYEDALKYGAQWHYQWWRRNFLKTAQISMTPTSGREIEKQTTE